MEAVTVSIPTWRTPPDLVARAVASVLDQTHTDLTVVLIGDGVDPPRLPDHDPRLVTFALDVNRGRYYADAVVATAARTPRFTCHDDDDVSDPTRLATLLAAGPGADVIAGGIVDVHLDGRLRYVAPRTRPHADRLTHLWHVSAIYRTEVVRPLLHPGFRVGYDTLLSSLLAWSADVVHVGAALYRREQRDGSLTQDEATSIGSPYRREQVARLTDLHRRCYSVVARRGPTARERIAEILAADAGPALAAAVATDAARLAELLPAPPPPEPVDATDLAVTILTGGRPDLLAETLSTLRATTPGLLDTARVSVLHNGADRATAEILATHRDVIDEVLSNADGIAPIGPSISMLADRAARSGRPYWLHLEDDWRAVDDPGWYPRAREILARRPEVAQVRLRHYGERVLARHMVTRAPLVWDRHDGFALSPDAHLTFNPSLVRTSTIGDGWPCAGEGDAQRRWHAAGRRATAQLLPGAFVHLGDADSLRRRTDRP